MTIQYRQQTSKKLNAVSQKHFSFRQKLTYTLLAAHIKSSLIETLLLFLEYAQLLSQALLTYSFFHNDQTQDDFLFLRGIKYFAKLFNPTYLLNYESEYNSTKTILFLIFAGLALKLLLYVYIFFISATKLQPHPLALKIFQWIFQAQARVIYYFATSFFVRVIIVNNQNEDQFSFLGAGKNADLAVCLLIIILEFCLSSLLKINFHYVLPSKSLLASKDNFSEIITLSQKFLLQILQIILWKDSEAAHWLFIIVNCIFSAIRDFQFFKVLPLYRIDALLFQGSLLVIISAFHFTSLIQQIIISSQTTHLHNVNNLEFTIFVWTVLALLAVIASYVYLNKTIVALVTQQTCQEPKLLVHKISLFKQLMDNRRLFEESHKVFDQLYLLTTTVNISISNAFGVPQPKENKANSKETIKSISVIYLESLFQRFPHHGIIKLYLAFYYAKNDKFYARAVALLNEFQNQGWSKEALSSYFLLHNIEEKIKAEYKNNSHTIDLHGAIKSFASFDQIKKDILEQSEIQTKVCQELLSDSPDLSLVFDKAQLAASVKRKAEARINSFLHESPDYYMNPLLLFAYYQLVINHSPGDCSKIFEKYHFLTQKYHKYLKSDQLCQRNVYQDNCAFFILSGQKSDFGKILYCNKAVKKVCGADVKWYIDSKIYHATPLPSLHTVWENYFKSMAETGMSPFYNQVLRGFIYNKGGYLKEIDYYLNTHPSITQGYFMMLTMRSPLTKKDFIILRENGEIEGASKKVCKRLGIFITDHSNQKFHIRMISKELARVNEAFNITKKHSKSLPELDTKEAQDITTLYLQEGNELILKSLLKTDEDGFQLHGDDDKFLYHCKISSLDYETVTLKIIHLEEIKNDHETEIIDLIEENHDVAPPIKHRFEETTISEHSHEEEENNAGAEEKENGWIDFFALDSRDVTQRQPPHTTKEKTFSSRGLLEYISNSVRKSQLKIEFPDSSWKDEKKKINPHYTKIIKRHQTISPDLPDYKRILEYESLSSDARSLQKKNKQLYKEVIVPKKVAESVKNSTSSKHSSRKRMIEGFKLAVKTNSNSKIFKAGAGCYLLIIILTLLSILYLFLNLSNITDDLRTKKEIMVNAQTRAFNLATVQTTMRTQYDLVTGGLTQAEMGKAAKPASSYTSINNGYVSPILQTNQNLLEMAGELDDTSRGTFFDRDVRVYYTEDSVKLTSFQATEIVIQSILSIVALFTETQGVSADLESFTNVNILNDVALKNDEISTVTMTSAQDQVDSIQGIVNQYFIFVSLLMVALICALTALVLLQHFRKKKNLLQVSRLNLKGVQFVLDNHRNFKTAMNADCELNEAKFFNLTEKFKSSSITSIIMTEKSKRKEIFVNSNFSGIQKRLKIQILKAIMLPLILSLPLIFTTLFASSSLDYFKNKLSQISFATQISTKVTRAMSASVELPISNDTLLIQDMLASEASGLAITEIDKIRNQIFDVFSDSDDTIAIPQINRVLLGNGCDVLGITDIAYCSILSAYSLNTSMVQLLWSYENVLSDRYQDYLDSNRSAAALRANRILHFDTMISMRRVIANEGLKILTSLNETFENKTITFNHQRKVNFHCSWGVFAVLAVVIWILILWPVQQSDFKFKKVLQIFPAQLVLSNFALKLFLLETSPFSMLFISD